jgi:hypothetical protein
VRERGRARAPVWYSDSVCAGMFMCAKVTAWAHAGMCMREVDGPRVCAGKRGRIDVCMGERARVSVCERDRQLALAYVCVRRRLGLRMFLCAGERSVACVCERLGARLCGRWSTSEGVSVCEREPVCVRERWFTHAREI